MLKASPSEGALRPRRGWCAYRVTGAASLPPWADEVALAVERPVDLHPEGFPSHHDGMPGGPPGPRGLGSHTDGVLDEPRGPREPGTQVEAIVLLKAAGRANWLAGMVEAAAEVEAAAGVRRFTDADQLAESPLGGAVTPARWSVATWTGGHSSCRRAGAAGSCRGAGSCRSIAALATGGRERAGVVGGRRGRCPDLRRSERRVGPGGGRAPRRREDQRDHPTAGRCPGAPRLANEKHLGCGMWAGPWRR